MSAYIVDKAHIDALIRAAVDHRASYWRADPCRPTGGDRISATRENRDVIGQMLTDANVESVHYRYPDDDRTNLPGRTDAWWVLPYRYSPRGPILSPVQGLKAINGYEYQACEPPTWPTSEAHAFCDDLRGYLIHALPGYEAAEWSIDQEDAAAAPVVLSIADMAAENRETEARALTDWSLWRDAWIPGGE